MLNWGTLIVLVGGIGYYASPIGGLVMIVVGGLLACVGLYREV